MGKNEINPLNTRTVLRRFAETTQKNISQGLFEAKKRGCTNRAILTEHRIDVLF